MNRARTTLALLVVIPAAFAWACGGDDSTTDDGGADSGGNDGTVGDTGPKNDGSGSDGTTNDTGANDTGASDTGTTDGGGIQDSSVPDSFACTKPSDCTNEFCCGTIVFNGGQLPNCKLEDASSACSATCKSNIQLSCVATDTVRTCSTNADCTDAGNNYNNCCTVPFGTTTAEFCWNKGTASLISGSSCQ
ncbi:MAG TPA: hypothetical protein VH054_06985 [Polyangiaceae bacterium]|nr:hypothetical protein [Polyangiaceae bacterium]